MVKRGFRIQDSSVEIYEQCQLVFSVYHGEMIANKYGKDNYAKEKYKY